MASRAIDMLDTAPRFTPADVARLNARFAGADAEAVLRAVFAEAGAGRAALVSSFGAESAVLLHMVAAIEPAAPVLFLETGKHFAETLAYREALSAHLGLTRVISLTPEPAVLAARDASGLRWSYDPDGCCAIRKVAPLAAALAGFDASVTGRKGHQNAARAGLAHFEIDFSDSAGRLKVNPLADWDAARVAAYLAEHALPPHPLVADGFASIGCSPCTGKIAEGEDARAGRWRGWDKTECGIHDVAGSAAALGADGADKLPPGFEPAF